MSFFADGFFAAGFFGGAFGEGASSSVVAEAPSVGYQGSYGRWVLPESDRRSRRSSVVSAQAWDESQSWSRVSAGIVKVARAAVAKVNAARVVGRQSALTRGAVEGLATSRAIAVSRGAAAANVIGLGATRFRGISRGTVAATPVRFAFASAQSLSLGRAGAHGEVPAQTTRSLSFSRARADAEREVVFTPEQLQMLTVIVARTFFND